MLSETRLAAVTVPANLFGLSGSLRITTLWTYTNSALNVRYSGSGGTQFVTHVATTSGALPRMTGH
jgi:hypothetical protein